MFAKIDFEKEVVFEKIMFEKKIVSKIKIFIKKKYYQGRTVQECGYKSFFVY